MVPESQVVSVLIYYGPISSFYLMPLAKEMAQLIKYLPSKYEDPNSMPRTHLQKPSLYSRPGRQRQEDPWGSLVSQPSLIDKF